jgi:hypothetical protein
MPTFHPFTTDSEIGLSSYTRISSYLWQTSEMSLLPLNIKIRHELALSRISWILITTHNKDHQIIRSKDLNASQNRNNQID